MKLCNESLEYNSCFKLEFLKSVQYDPHTLCVYINWVSEQSSRIAWRCRNGHHDTFECRCLFPSRKGLTFLDILNVEQNREQNFNSHNLETLQRQEITVEFEGRGRKAERSILWRIMKHPKVTKPLSCFLPSLQVRYMLRKAACHTAGSVAPNHIKSYYPQTPATHRIFRQYRWNYLYWYVHPSPPFSLILSAADISEFKKTSNLGRNYYYYYYYYWFILNVITTRLYINPHYFYFMPF
jgi:hypothetical protein